MKTQTKNYKKERNLFIASITTFIFVVGYIVYNAIAMGLMNGSTYASGVTKSIKFKSTNISTSESRIKRTPLASRCVPFGSLESEHAVSELATVSKVVVNFNNFLNIF